MKIYTGYDEHTNTRYHKSFDLVDELPELESVDRLIASEKEGCIAIAPALVDCSDQNAGRAYEAAIFSADLYQHAIENGASKTEAIAEATEYKGLVLKPVTEEDAAKVYYLIDTNAARQLVSVDRDNCIAKVLATAEVQDMDYLPHIDDIDDSSWDDGFDFDAVVAMLNGASEVDVDILDTAF